jgi:hypothetical protein
MKRLLPVLLILFGAALGCDDKKDSPKSQVNPGDKPTKGELPKPPPIPPPPGK